MTAVLSGCSGNTETSTNSEQLSGISSKTEESNMNSEMTAETSSEKADESVSSEKESRTETNISSETVKSTVNSKTTTKTLPEGADENVSSEKSNETHISKDTEITSIYKETTDAVSETTEYSGYRYSVSEVAGTWYLNGDLTSDRMTVDYEGNFANVSKNGTVISGQVRIESNQEQDGSTSHGYAFYKNDGSLWCTFSATGNIPVYHLY